MMTMASLYKELTEEGNKLLETFTIQYPYGLYKESFYSNTYDGLTKFVNKLLILVADMEPMKKEDPLYKLVRTYRGRIGNLDLVEFKKLLSLLEERALEKSR
ncbi:hypothetical protein [Youngiibacter fragilis]|uniref:Uncharacterized protein n=1 Tax=Youngiibacter fragilis 232.1 TaxID=994573 RepID=V7I020_9CLOT|nr:hypothetical protein [Youngiibacter fragilis]ETA79223.1 hypothetical protein T472_0218055 [Youngiibacter fragilis 232.1]